MCNWLLNTFKIKTVFKKHLRPIRPSYTIFHYNLFAVQILEDVPQNIELSTKNSSFSVSNVFWGCWVVEQTGSVKMFRVPSAIRFQNLTETIFSALAYPPTERARRLTCFSWDQGGCMQQIIRGEGQSDKWSLVRPPAKSITCHWGRYRSFSFLQATPSFRSRTLEGGF